MTTLNSPETMPYYHHPLPANQDPRRTRKQYCKKCKQRIILIPSAKSRGARFIPCNVDQVYGDGEKTLVALDDNLHGHMIPKADPNVLGREPHFGRNCPEGLLDQLDAQYAPSST